MIHMLSRRPTSSEAALFLLGLVPVVPRLPGPTSATMPAPLGHSCPSLTKVHVRVDYLGTLTAQVLPTTKLSMQEINHLPSIFRQCAHSSRSLQQYGLEIEG